jgi:hypothetical protein
MSTIYDRHRTHPEGGRRPLGRAVRSVLVVVALARAMQFVEAVLFPLVAVERGAGATGGATVLLSLALGSTAGSLSGGSAVDRWGARSTATGGLATAAVAAGALAAADRLALLAAAAALYGLAAAAWRLALEAATSEGLAADGSEAADGDARSRERAFGAFVWLVNLGALASAGALAAGIGLRAAVAGQAAATAVAALAAAASLPRSTPGGGLAARGLRDVPLRMWLLAMAFAPLTMVMFQAFAGLAEIFDPREYRAMVLVNASVLVAFPPALWALAERVDGLHAIAAAAVAQGAGMAVAAITKDAYLATVAWSAGEATLIAVIPAVVAGIAPHGAAGSYRAAFATAQGAAAAVATFAGPLVARSSVPAFAVACLALTGAGVAAIGAHGRFIEAGLRQPVACPCGALLCACDADHIACAYPSPIVVHGAAPAGHA